MIDDIDNLRPMHWKNNVKKSNNFPTYPGDVSAAGCINFDVSRDYQINRDQINILRNLYGEYLEIPQPSILGQWQVVVGRNIVPATFFDEIVTYSINDID